MSDGLNKVMLLGGLGADPELRWTQGGQAVLHMRLATTESFLDKDKVRRERTEWHRVTVWGKRGEALAKFLTKGSTVFIEGSLRTTSYDDRDGTKRYSTEINANNIILTGGKGGGGERHVDRGDGDQRTGDDGSRGGRGGGYSRGGGGGGGGGYSRGGGGGQRQSAPREENAGPAADAGYGGGGGGRGAPAADVEPPMDEGGGYGGDDDIPFISAQLRWWKP